MDKVAFIVASRYARRSVVTACSEECEFHVPVRQGQLVELRARIASTGTTSMRVDVDLCSEYLITGEHQLATRGRFELVALDAHGRSAQIPAITVDAQG